ncbi:MAG: hypothetical protein ACTSQ8_17385 [Candidatus Helarchaeota archaeon]
MKMSAKKARKRLSVFKKIISEVNSLGVSSRVLYYIYKGSTYECIIRKKRCISIAIISPRKYVTRFSMSKDLVFDGKNLMWGEKALKALFKIKEFSEGMKKWASRIDLIIVY